VVDDHLMEITHILRGNEFISSTPKHAVLFDVLGWKRPIWVHLPLIIGSDGAKLSKRHGDTDALQYRDKGYLPEAMINYLAMLGWNDGTEQEIFTADELVEKFSLDRIQKSPAKFDFERLDWMNGIYIREKLTEDEYVERATVELRSSDVLRDDTSAELIRGAVLLERERIKIFSELPDFVSFFFKRPKVTKDLLTAKLAPEVVKTMLEQSASALDGVDKNIKGHDAIEKALRDLVIEHDYKSGEVFSSIRIAITGRTTAPGLFETINVLGVEETRTRIQAAVARL
jgi:glutamyl-tRNA synthetase